jgi:hypothetical protein
MGPQCVNRTPRQTAKIDRTFFLFKKLIGLMQGPAGVQIFQKMNSEEHLEMFLQQSNCIFRFQSIASMALGARLHVLAALLAAPAAFVV